jgi:alkyl sulfatase BDS1-like metallo-beta-lactamase superfamily hydrolase
VVGAARVHQALSDTALWLETLVNETVTRMNAGLALEDILAEVKPPAHLSERPYLQAVYDEPDYVIRNIWRLYGGWWDGQPAHLKPAREAEIGLEVAALAGGIDAMVARARVLAAEGRLELASHLIDWAAAATPNKWAVHDARADIYLARAQNSEALMTRGIFSEAARESAIKAGRPVTKPAPPGDSESRQADRR